jgi:hypothetical protein
MNKNETAENDKMLKDILGAWADINMQCSTGDGGVIVFPEKHKDDARARFCKIITRKHFKRLARCAAAGERVMIFEDEVKYEKINGNDAKGRLLLKSRLQRSVEQSGYKVV